MKVSVLSAHLSQVDAHQSPTFTSDYAPRGSHFLFSPAISAYTTVSHRATRNCLRYSQTLADACKKQSGGVLAWLSETKISEYGLEVKTETLAK